MRARAVRRGWATIACALAVLTDAKAWGPEGHEVVALIAERHLTNRTRQRVDALLALEPGATLASVSRWADDARERSTAHWHFVNLPRGAGCVYMAVRDCPDGQCVVAAIEAQTRRLATAASPLDRLEALKYVVHLVADVHQPLHAGFREDRGGNGWQLQAFGRGTNLHAVWDSTIVAAIDRRPRSLAALIDAAPGSRASVSFAPAQWAAESCRIVSRPDFYPDRTLGESYVQRFEPVVRERLLASGLRLSALLNDVLGAPTPRR